MKSAILVLLVGLIYLSVPSATAQIAEGTCLYVSGYATRGAISVIWPDLRTSSVAGAESPNELTPSRFGFDIVNSSIYYVQSSWSSEGFQFELYQYTPSNGSNERLALLPLDLGPVDGPVKMKDDVLYISAQTGQHMYANGNVQSIRLVEPGSDAMPGIYSQLFTESRVVVITSNGAVLSMNLQGADIEEHGFLPVEVLGAYGEGAEVSEHVYIVANPPIGFRRIDANQLVDCGADCIAKEDNFTFFEYDDEGSLFNTLGGLSSAWTVAYANDTAYFVLRVAGLTFYIPCNETNGENSTSVQAQFLEVNGMVAPRAQFMRAYSCDVANETSPMPSPPEEPGVEPLPPAPMEPPPPPPSPPPPATPPPPQSPGSVSLPSLWLTLGVVYAVVLLL